MQEIKAVENILIHNRRNKLFVSLLDIAEATNNEFQSVTRFVRNKEEVFKSVGLEIKRVISKDSVLIQLFYLLRKTDRKIGQQFY